tara:strand:+ start:258 stop:443 length:186 start_codon:yes stop_codon:yes gene_type:complete
VKIETEIANILFKEMKSFIKKNPNSDQKSFLTSALNSFLFRNGSEDRRVAENYMDDLFNKS